MTLTSFFVFLHVIAAFGLVAGIVGRDILLGQARRSTAIERIRTLVAGAGPFERYLARPGSIAVLLLGVLVWWQEDIPLWGEGTRWVTVSLVLFLSIVPLIPLVFIPRGKVFEAALSSASDEGTLTPQLSEALRDPAVAAARWYELVAIAIVLLLMVTKPF